MRKVNFDTSWIARRAGHEIPQAELPDWLNDIASYDNTAGTSRSSINEWGYWFTDDYGGEEILFPDGYDRIFDAFRGGYQLTLNQIVTGIDYSGKQARVLTRKDEHVFDAVIVTVPLGVLKAGTLTFNPDLPQSVQNAIKRLGYGTLDKIYMQFDTVFWDQEPHNILTPDNGLEPGFFNSWVNLYPVTGKPVLLCFNGGPAALALASEND